MRACVRVTRNTHTVALTFRKCVPVCVRVSGRVCSVDDAFNGRVYSEAFSRRKSQLNILSAISALLSDSICFPFCQNRISTL